VLKQEGTRDGVRKVLFVINNDFTSSELRGDHIAAHLGERVLFQTIDGARNQTIVFVKDVDRGLVLDAKDRGNKIVLDVIDFYCYRGKRYEWGDLIDVLIVPNRSCISFYKRDFPNARFAVIPHQWDFRISGAAPQDQVRTAYIGKAFNRPEFWKGASVVLTEDFLPNVAKYNLHIALQRRHDLDILLKPCTKISTASAVSANVITFDDPGAVELLGWDYPYLVNKDMDPWEAIEYARGNFGSPSWKRGRDRMREVKEKTSLRAVGKLYRRLADGDESLFEPVMMEAA
jgi:hypothetical protein